MVSAARQQRGWLLVNGVLLALVMWSALGVIDSSHLCRGVYASLHVLQREQWNLQENWHRLVLESGATSTPHEVEQEAERLLGMHIPAVADVRRVQR